MSKLLMMTVGRGDDECISAVALPFYTLQQVVEQRFGHLSTDPSPSLGAALTLHGEQLSCQVVPRGFGHASTDPSPSFLQEWTVGRANASPGSSTSRNGFHHQRRSSSSSSRHHTHCTSRTRPTVFL